MAKNSQADPRRMYSWWWDSHISPKNSKWLQENLTDMDAKVKQMIKVIEEDADSFARRAEMYYKKRPELMKLVEEFYRAYRALAERYNHATGVIRQAHRQIAEAFPNQMPFGMPDDSPVGSANEGDAHTPDLTPVQAIFEPDELQKDALGNSLANSHGLMRNGGFGDESDSVPGRKDLKQLNDLFGSGIAEAKARKGLNFHDSEEKDVKARGPSDSERVSKAEQEIESLKSAIAKLEAEKEAGLVQYQQSMERLSRLESEVSNVKDDSKVLNERASNAEAQVETLKGSLAKLQAERETSLLQYQQCLEKISNLESSILLAKKDSDEISERASKAEDEAQSLKQELGRVEAEKREALVQYNQCLEKISDLERKLLLAEEDAKSHKQRADKAETEVETLKEEINELTEEIDTTAVRYQQCMERISVLEGQLASAQEEVKRLNAEIDDGVARLKGAEERCLLLENSNQTIHSELETLSEKMAAQREELTEKQKELGRLWTCIQEERLRFVEAETAFQTLQHLHSQSQEELRSMAAELQQRAHILEDLEAHNQNLQNEAEQVKLVNKDLNEVNLSSALTIQHLQDEISSLRETVQKLEAEVELRVDQRNALQQEIYCLKEELNELKKNHSAIVEQVESVGLCSTNFSTSVKDMQDESIKLKEASERDKTEKVALLEKLAIMEKLVQKNSLLENSLTDLNVELEAVREKVKGLEESCQHILGEKSTLASEKATLVSELQVATENLEKLTERNNTVENFLFDASAELEQLRVKSKNLEDLCQLLEKEKLDLVSAKEGLISQLDVSQSKMVDVEKNYSNLEQKYFSLEKERELALRESEDVRANLDILKQEHLSLVQLSESQLADMSSKISSLEKVIERKNKEYAEELDKAVNAEMEIFIWRTSAKDLEEKNCSILLECQKLLEASKLSKKLISVLENENLEQHGELKSLFAHLEELRMKLYLVMKTLELDVDQQCGDKAQQDKILLDNVLEKLQQTHELLCKMQDENQQSAIEKTVLITLIEQLHLEVSNLAAANISLNKELMTTSEKLLLSQSDSKKLTALTEELRLKVMEGDQKEQVLKVGLSKLHEELLRAVEAKQNLQEESIRLQGEQTHLMLSLSDLEKQKSNLEEENCGIFAESFSQSILSLMLRDVIRGNSATIKDLNGSLDKLSHANNDLSEKVTMMDGKLERLGVIEIERLELQRELADMKCKYDEVETSRAEGEKQIVKLSDDNDQHQREIECLQDTNHKLESDMCKLRDELLEFTQREDSLKHELEERRLEISQWESDISATLGKLQMSTVREALFEGKVHELIEACESLNNRNCSNTLEIKQLKERVGTLEGENGELKSQMHACIPSFVSLRDSVTSLENYTTQHDTHYGTESKEAQDAPQVVLQESGEQIDEQSSMDLRGLLELQIRIKGIEKALMQKEHEFLVPNSKIGGRARNGGRVQKHCQEISEEGHEVMTKDIMLDQISECSSYGLSRRETDQMMEIWETANQDGSIDLTVGKTEKVNSAGVEKKHKKQNPSAESLVDKEVSVDKLEISKRFSGTNQETNGRKILERLDSDAQKLTNLQITVQDLMRKVEITEKTKKGKDIEYYSVREQLGESEDAIQKLFDFNRKLVKNIEDDPVYSDDKEASASDAKSRVKRRSIAEQARRGSEKIGRLQLEVQKLQFLLLKLDDQNKSSRGKTKIMDRKSRVPLRDYLYGGGLRSGSNQSRKKGHFCACVQPPTKGD